MSVTKVEVRTRRGNLLTLPLEEISQGLLVADIQGLDPVKAMLVTSSFAGVDGEQFHSSRRETRNIKLLLEIHPDWEVDDVQSVRNRVYNFFMPETEVNLRFFLWNDLTVDIWGRVESCETPLFTQEPAINISILNPDPDFYDATAVTTSGSTTSTTTETLLNYDGSVESGINFTLNVNRTLDEFTIYHHTPAGDIRSMLFDYAMLNGDVIKISTVRGAKGATLTRGGVTTSALYAIPPQAHWIQLEPGDNYLRVYATGAAVPFTMEHLNRYGGL